MAFSILLLDDGTTDNGKRRYQTVAIYIDPESIDFQVDIYVNA